MRWPGRYHGSETPDARKEDRPPVKPDMKVSLAGMELVNPVIAASGTFGYGIEFEEIRLAGAAGRVCDQGNLAGADGRASRRRGIIQTAAGMLNAIGLQNVGVNDYLEKKLPPMKRYPQCKVIVNVFGYTVAEYVEVIEQLNHARGNCGVRAECLLPQCARGRNGVSARIAAALEYLVGTAKTLRRRPLIVKLSPNVTSIAQMARVAATCGADALSLVNTFLAMSIDVEERQPRLTNVTGGLSGPAIKPIALRMVYEAAKAVSIPILGMGGIVTPEDAVEFLLAGATAVQVGTASYADPRATERLARGPGILVQEPSGGTGGELDGGSGSAERVSGTLLRPPGAAPTFSLFVVTLA